MIVQVCFRTITEKRKRCINESGIVTFCYDEFKILLCALFYYKINVKLFVLVFVLKVI